jgi:hypothetical protein
LVKTSQPEIILSPRSAGRATMPAQRTEWAERADDRDNSGYEAALSRPGVRACQEIKHPILAADQHR